VAERLAREAPLPLLAAALGRRRVPNVAAELAGIVGELYDTLARNRRGLKLIDRSARDLPELAALWFEGTRGGLVAQLVRYLEDRTRRRLLRTMPDAATTARLVLETTVFWAVHRHWDAHPDPVPDATARATVVGFVTAALAGE
jgi:hypothetical protein